MVSRRDLLKRLGTGVLLLPAPVFGQSDEKAITIRRLSWAGISIESATTSLFIDPWITPAIWDGAWKDPVVPLQPKNARRAVLITHLHNDHFDPAALRELIGERGQVICSAGMAPGIASRGFRVRAVESFQPEAFGDFIVIPVPASDGLGESQVSWMVAARDRRIIHCGDTLWHGRFRLIGRALGPFDYAFLPINGARIGDEQPASGVPDVMTPEQAVAAAILLRARTLVPIHYGMSSSDYIELPDAPKRVNEVAAQRGLTVRVMSPGEEMAWR